MLRAGGVGRRAAARQSRPEQPLRRGPRAAPRASSSRTTGPRWAKWIETQQIISKERKDWQQEKEILLGRIEVVKQEVTTLEEKIKQAETTVAEAEKKKAGARRRERPAQGGRRAADRGRRDASRAKSAACSSGCPEPDPDEDPAALPAHSRGSVEHARSSVAERFQNVHRHPERGQQGEQRDHA